jgi:hypothetical protein
LPRAVPGAFVFPVGEDVRESFRDNDQTVAEFTAPLAGLHRIGVVAISLIGLAADHAAFRFFGHEVTSVRT